MQYRGENRAPGTGGRKQCRKQGRNGNEDEDGNGGEERDSGGNWNGSGDRDENREEGGREREFRDIPSESRTGVEDLRGGVTPARNQEPQQHDPTLQRDRRIMWRIRSQRREARNKTREGGGAATKRKKPLV